MININELENRWRTYKIKSYIPHVVIAFSLIAIVSTIYYVSDTKEENTLPIPKGIKTQVSSVNKNLSHEQNDVLVKKDIAVSKTITHNRSTKSIVLSPSLGFMSNLKHGNIYNNDTNNFKDKNQIDTNNKPQIMEIVMEKGEEEIIQEPLTIKKKSIKIDRKSSKDDLEYVIERFKKNNNPALSLFIAKKYYSLGQYHKAYNYALMTNELNDKIDACWVLFAKSLVKLNEKEEAIKTLKKYITYSNSNQAKILLEEIISGDFK